MRGKWRIKCHLFDQHNGALYPLLEGVGSESGPDEEMWRWIAHKARPTLSVRDERLYDGWQLSESLESNALVLYEFTPLVLMRPKRRRFTPRGRRSLPCRSL